DARRLAQVEPQEAPAAPTKLGQREERGSQLRRMRLVCSSGFLRRLRGRRVRRTEARIEDPFGIVVGAQLCHLARILRRQKIFWELIEPVIVDLSGTVVGGVLAK